MIPGSLCSSCAALTARSTAMEACVTIAGSFEMQPKETGMAAAMSHLNAPFMSLVASSTCTLLNFKERSNLSQDSSGGAGYTGRHGTQ